MRSNRASKTGIQLKMFRKQLTKQFRGLSIIHTKSCLCPTWYFFKTMTKPSSWNPPFISIMQNMNWVPLIGKVLFLATVLGKLFPRMSSVISNFDMWMVLKWKSRWSLNNSKSRYVNEHFCWDLKNSGHVQLGHGFTLLLCFVSAHFCISSVMICIQILVSKDHIPDTSW